MMAGPRRRTWIILLVVVAAVAGLAAWLLLAGGVTVPDVTGKTQAEAVQLLEGAGLEVGQVAQVADQVVPAGAVVSQDPAAGAEVDGGSAVSLTVSSGPGTAEVPDVTGMNVADAQEELTAAGFEPVTSFQYDAEAPKDEVMAQLPAGGDQAYPGSSVGLLVSRGLPERVDVPDVTGMSQQDATNALADAGLQAVPVEAYDDEAPEGTVADQDPAAGTTVTPLSEVLVTVSLGEGTATVTVPDVVGQVQDDAEDELAAAGLDATSAQAYSDVVDEGVVISQEPAAGEKVEEGGTVGLLVSLGPSPASGSTSSPSPSPSPSASEPPGGGITPPPDIAVDIVTVPDLVGMQGEQAQAELTELGLRPVPLEAPSETVAAGTVAAQLPRAGTRLPQTFPVLLLVSLGPPPQVNPLPADE
jgi:serine/threonine-protein kinase